MVSVRSWFFAIPICLAVFVSGKQSYAGEQPLTLFDPISTMASWTYGAEIEPEKLQKLQALLAGPESLDWSSFKRAIDKLYAEKVIGGLTLEAPIGCGKLDWKMPSRETLFENEKNMKCFLAISSSSLMHIFLAQQHLGTMINSPDKEDKTGMVLLRNMILFQLIPSFEISISAEGCDELL